MSAPPDVLAAVRPWILRGEEDRRAIEGLLGQNELVMTEAIQTPLPGIPPAVLADIQEMVRRIVAEFDPEKIILFGSHARGTGSPESDVDLLVILRFTGPKRVKRVHIRMAIHDVGLAKDIVVATPEEAERYRDLPGTILGPAQRDGRVLYERAH